MDQPAPQPNPGVIPAHAFLQELQALGEDGERVEEISPELYSAGYQRYHDRVRDFFRRWLPILISSSAVAAGALGGSTTFILVIGLASSAGGAVAAIIAIRQIEKALTAGIHDFICAPDDDRMALTPESFQSLSDAIFVMVEKGS